MEDWQRWYIVGWSFVDYKRFNHFKSPEEEDVADITFRCPNQHHLNILLRALHEDSVGYYHVRYSSEDMPMRPKLSSIVMLHMVPSLEGFSKLKDWGLGHMLFLKFEEALEHGQSAFLRGYLEHQTFEFLPQTLEAHAKRFHMTFSSLSQLECIRKFIGEEEFYYEDSTKVEDVHEDKIVKAAMDAKSVLNLFSRCVYSNPKTFKFQSYFTKRIIPGILKSLGIGSVFIETKASDLQNGFTIQVSVADVLWRPLPNGQKQVSLIWEETVSSLMTLPRGLIGLEVEAKPLTSAAAEFLDACSISSTTPRNHDATELKLIYSGSPVDIPKAEEFQVQLSYVNREWIVTRTVESS